MRSLATAFALGYVAVASAFMTTPFTTATPKLRSATTGASTICMGRKGAQTGKGGGQTRTVTRDKKKGGVAIIKVKKTKDDVSRASILKSLETATKDNFADAILNSKVETFMKEDAGSSLYPRLMRKIKFTAKKVGATVPDRWCYEAMANKKAREALEAKKNAPAEEAEEGEEGAAAE